jgi:hypothetical protein
MVEPGRSVKLVEDRSRELRAEISISPLGHAPRCLAGSGFLKVFLFHGPFRAALIASLTALGMRQATKVLYH